MTLYFYSLVKNLISKEISVIEETAEVKETPFKYISLDKKELPRRNVRQLNKDDIENGKVFVYPKDSILFGTIYQVVFLKNDREEAIRLMKNCAEKDLEELKAREERQKTIVEAIK